MAILSFKELKEKSKIKPDTAPVKLAILSDTTTQFLEIALKGMAVVENLNIDVLLGGHGQIEELAMNPQSDLFVFKPDFVLIYLSSNNLQETFYKQPLPERPHFSTLCKQRIENLVSKINTDIIVFNFPEITDGIFGNYANKNTSSLLYQTRKLNLELCQLAIHSKNIHVLDLATILNYFGRKHATDSKLYVNAGIELNLNVLPFLAKEIVNLLMVCKGKIKKCLILDLDNTLWGGIIGDDGLNGIHLGNLGIGKAFVRLQIWVKELKNRGIILAVCSKNDEEIAKEPFLKHPDSVLKLDDFAIFVANWKDKVENIKFIQSVLNVGFDSMVFLDDNPVERDWVKQQLPDITVPSLPKDPAEYLDFLQLANYFETSGISGTDAERTEQYQNEAKRKQHQQTFNTFEEYLTNLDMYAILEPVNEFNLPRAAQLSQRSNQFNFRTLRYSEKELYAIANSKNYLTFCINLRDKFGDYGMIGLVVLKQDGRTYFIENWLMSCRVFNRGVEQFTLNQIVVAAMENGAEDIVGEYIPTKKNGIIRHFFQEHNFRNIQKKWWLSLPDYKKRPTTVQLLLQKTT